MKHTWQDNTCTRCGCKRSKQWANKWSYYVYSRGERSGEYIDCLDWNDNKVTGEEIMGWQAEAQQ
jgi:hypothetical protein